MNRNQKGCFAEYHFSTTAMQNGFNVSVPLLDSSPYDCILEKKGKLFKIQVKYLGEKRYKHGRSVQVTLKREGKKIMIWNLLIFLHYGMRSKKVFTS